MEKWSHLIKNKILFVHIYVGKRVTISIKTLIRAYLLTVQSLGKKKKKWRNGSSSLSPFLLLLSSKVFTTSYSPNGGFLPGRLHSRSSAASCGFGSHTPSSKPPFRLSTPSTAQSSPSKSGPTPTSSSPQNP